MPVLEVSGLVDSVRHPTGRRRVRVLHESTGRPLGGESPAYTWSKGKALTPSSSRKGWADLRRMRAFWLIMGASTTARDVCPLAVGSRQPAAIHGETSRRAFHVAPAHSPVHTNLGWAHVLRPKAAGRTPPTWSLWACRAASWAAERACAAWGATPWCAAARSSRIGRTSQGWTRRRQTRRTSSAAPR